MAKSDIKTFEPDLPFPILGVDEQRAYSRQRPGTCADALNVRAVDPLTDRARGGTRPGLEKLYYDNYDGSAVTNFPIQEINQLTTMTPAPPVVGDYLQFTYAQASGSGFSLGTGNDGANLITLPSSPISGEAMSCSCWDDEGFVYVAMTHTGNNTVRIYKVSRLGVIQWTVGGFALTGSSLRSVAGLAWIRVTPSLAYLFVALTNTIAKIFRLNAANGISPDGGFAFTETNATLQNLTWSTASHNCLGSAGGVLGVESAGNPAGANHGFRTYNPAIIAITGNVSSVSSTVAISGFAVNTIPGLLTFTGWGGTRSNEATRVASDGSNFYIIASQTITKLKKVSSGGALMLSNTTAYQTTGSGSPIAIDYDFRNNKLVLVSSVTPFVRFVEPTAFAVSADSTGKPADIAWSEVGSDGNGTAMLFLSAAASNNWMTVTTAAVAIIALGTFNIPNTTQIGCAVNKGPGSAPPTPQAGPVKLISILVKNGRPHEFNKPAEGDGPKPLTVTGTVVPEGGGPFNPLAPEIFSAQNGPDLFFADGNVYYYYASATGTVKPWALTAGTLPLDSDGKASKHICTWNGRTVLVIGRNFYMSRQFAPFDFDYDPSTITSARAFSGNADLAGALGNLITCIIPFNDDTMLFGMDHALWQLSGDPTTTGAFDVISQSLGIAFGRPYCFDQKNVLYFFGSDCMVYRMMANSAPEPMAGNIRERLKRIDLSRCRIKMVWDQDKDGLHLFAAPTGTGDVFQDPAAGTPSNPDGTGMIDLLPTATGKALFGDTMHFFWEKRTEAWFPMKFLNRNHNPMAAFAYDGDLPQDRKIYLGGRDGFVRRIVNDGGDDDGTAIHSWVLLGPIMTKDWDNLIYEKLKATLSDNSGEVRYDFYHGKHVEEALTKALAGPSPINGIWTAGTNRVSPINREGFAFFVKLSSTDAWSFERIMQAYRTTGMIRKWQ